LTSASPSTSQATKISTGSGATSFFGLVAPVVRFSSLDEAVQLGKGTAAESGNGSRAGGP
jgi:hypothetical protein